MMRFKVCVITFFGVCSVESPRDPDLIHPCQNEYSKCVEGEEDLVLCHFCGLGLKDFIQSHEPLHEHVLFSESCEFLVQFLGPSRLKEIKERLLLKEEQQKETPILAASSRKSYQPQDSGAQKNHIQFRHPEYKSYFVRLASYAGWPRSLVQTPQQLAEAGFYYTGTRDIVRCFSCDGGLEKWDPTDEPWIEHCVNFSHCIFLKEIKGENFISLAISQRIRPKSLVGVTPSAIKTTGYSNIHIETKGSSVVPKLEEMGYSLPKVLYTVEKITKDGNDVTVESVIDLMEKLLISEEMTKTVDDQKNQSYEILLKHMRLKEELFCMQCKVADINTLFLPCQHHRLCTHCAERTTKCPVCGSNIDQKIRTYRP